MCLGCLDLYSGCLDCLDCLVVYWEVLWNVTLNVWAYVYCLVASLSAACSMSPANWTAIYSPGHIPFRFHRILQDSIGKYWKIYEHIRFTLMYNQNWMDSYVFWVSRLVFWLSGLSGCRLGSFVEMSMSL